MTSPESPTSVFIYGGCISRDTLELMKDQIRVVCYVARQSLISASNAALEVPAGSYLLGSPFQQRQLAGDIKSNLFELLGGHLADCDKIVIDLVVERLGVRSWGSGYLTFSNELMKSELGARITSKNTAIPFGSDLHFSLWKEGANKLFNVLDDGNAVHKTRILRTPWAIRTNDGSSLGTFRGSTPEEVNSMYSRYFEYLRSLGFQIIELPDELAIADVNHKWGVAQYHYIQEAYSWISEKLKSY